MFTVFYFKREKNYIYRGFINTQILLLLNYKLITNMKSQKTYVSFKMAGNFFFNLIRKILLKHFKVFLTLSISIFTNKIELVQIKL